MAIGPLLLTCISGISRLIVSGTGPNLPNIGAAHRWILNQFLVIAITADSEALVYRGKAVSV
jgi:hypothetical protein